MSGIILRSVRIVGVHCNFNARCYFAQRHSSDMIKYSCLMFQRHFSHRREVNEHAEYMFKQIDNIPDEYSIIYRAPLYNYVKSTYVVNFTGVVVFPIICLISLTNGGTQNYSSTMFGIPGISNEYELCASVFGLAMIAISVGMTVFSYPLRIYSNSETGHYIAIYQHTLPWKNKSEEFYAGEMKKSYSRLSLWNDGLYEFRSKKAILFEDYFRRPIDFHNMFIPIHGGKSED